ncbi:replication endonuclease [Serratia marcescens]|uniref:replication endonuclease n=1 Tax=Serratia marcescens TaxID=615 RepID=UPI0032605E09
MTHRLRGRHDPTPPLPYPGSGAVDFEYAYSWNAKRDAIVTERADEPASIQLFGATNHAGKPVRVPLFDIAGQSRVADPAPRRLRRRLAALPQYVRRYYTQRLNSLEQGKGMKAANGWLVNTFERHVLPRIDAVNEQYQIGQLPPALIAFRDDFFRIPYSGKKDLKRLAHRLADCMTGEFVRLCDYWAAAADDLAFAVIYAYGRIGYLAQHLNMFAPGWQQYCSGQLSAEDATRAVARLESPAWWLRRLRRLHDQWREHLMIAAGYVSDKATPYCSDPCLKEWHAQKKANREFLKSRELEDVDTGERVSLIDKVDSSVANPAVKRAELMNRMRGFEDLAKARDLAGEFYTLTAPSKYHAMQSKTGRRNNKYRGASPRETQRYLCKVWSKVRASWKRAGIRVFGFRVTEPHHDETPHWHLLLFLKPEHIEQARDIFRRYALQVDGDEPGAAEYRFSVKPMDEQFGSATGYIAKYISKNIDGYALDDELDHDTGEPLKDIAKRVNAWASRWRIRQFQQIGGAPVTVYRELRRMPGRDLFLYPQISPAHIAADGNDWVGYTEAQGGPLVERRNLRVRLAYEITESGNDYGDDISKIIGVYSPLSGIQATVYTRLITYKIVPAGTDPVLAVDLQAAAPPLGVLSITVRGTQQEEDRQGSISGLLPPDIDANDCARWPPGGDFEGMTRRERRAFNEYLIAEAKKTRSKQPAQHQRAEKSAQNLERLTDFAASIGLELTELEAKKLAGGDELSLNGKRWRAGADGTIREAPASYAEKRSAIMSRVFELKKHRAQP